jgi:hypothetical protein
VGAFNLAMWLFWAFLALFGFVSSLKRVTERITERFCMRRRNQRARDHCTSQHCVLAR